MRLDNLPFTIVWNKFTDKNFTDEFLKKYKTKQWKITKEAIEDSLIRIHNLQDTQQLDSIRSMDGYGIYKLDFKIAGTNESPKSSGNRAILFVDNHFHIVTILLVYHKNNIKKNQKETVWWEIIIKENFGEFWHKIIAN